jgi:hypothetical protein
LGLSLFHGHGSWLMCELAFVATKAGPKPNLHHPNVVIIHAILLLATVSRPTTTAPSLPRLL